MDSQDGPKRSPDGSYGPQHGSKRSQDGPKGTQGGPKMASRRRPEASKGAKLGPRRLIEIRGPEGGGGVSATHGNALDLCFTKVFDDFPETTSEPKTKPGTVGGEPPQGPGVGRGEGRYF